MTVQQKLGATLLFLALANPLVSQDTKKEFDRSPQNIGSVLVFSGTGWYRHPEVAAISGWLARRSPELQMQVDVSENPNDLLKILPKYKVLVFNNNTELTAILDARHQTAVRDWYRKGSGIVALHAALVRQTEWKWFNGLAGCDFDSDSEYLEARIIVDPKAKDHPVVRGHGMSFRYKADWTNHDRTVTGL